MKPAAFEYSRPDTLEAAIALLAQGGPDAKVLAGGQSLVPMMNLRLAQPRLIVDVNRIPGHDYIRRDRDELVIGFLARHEDVKRSEVVGEACPLIAAAYEHVAHGTIRNRGTLCGNLCHADPASEMPAVMLATEATMELQGPAGLRHVPAAQFFLGLYETALASDEMLVRLRIPVAPKGQGWGFHEVSTRKGDFAFVCVGALLTLKAGRISTAKVAAAGIGTRAVRLDAVERWLIGQEANQQTFQRAGREASSSVVPSGDSMVPAEYRSELLEILTRRALADAASRSN
ncbi:xanthine dehydrogenase family protein subunit M [Variovorax ureilyticus]|uniref:Xanthine dehydrogenase family protein subunit M n=1 Tax=Variovorax ureilyticus TaxID=1836198 RepID=A0ABU8VNP3_9BURK